jgi:hypothetical protein
VANGTAQSLATVIVTDAQGHSVKGDSVSFSSTDSGEKVGAVTDQGNGSYTVSITSSKTAYKVTITARDASVVPAISGHGTLTQTAAGPARMLFSCAKPSGRLSGRSLGPVQLDMARSTVRGRFTRSSLHKRSYTDSFCSSQSAIRVGYPSPKVLSGVSRGERRRLQGRVVLVLTADRRYRLDGVAAGTKLKRVANRLRVSKPFRVGGKTWYLTPGRSRRGLLLVRHQVIAEVGIAQPALLHSRSTATRFLRSFS